jgi:hypothetical protein
MSRVTRIEDVRAAYEATPPHRVEVVDRIGDGELRVPLRHVVKHSPSGFSWGYGGSGPADLALSILVDALGIEAQCVACHGTGKVLDPEEIEPSEHPCWDCWGDGIAPAVTAAYQTFKEEAIAPRPMDVPWRITRAMVLEWWSAHT